MCLLRTTKGISTKIFWMTGAMPLDPLCFLRGIARAANPKIAARPELEPNMRNKVRPEARVTLCV